MTQKASNGRTSFVERLRAIDDADLDVYEFRLYTHIWRVGVSWESQRTIAKKCNMSLGKVSAALRSLTDKNLLAYQERDGRLGLVAVLCSQDEQALQEECSPREQDVAVVHDMNADVHHMNADVHDMNASVHVVNAILSMPLEVSNSEVNNMKGERAPAPARKPAPAPVIRHAIPDRTPTGFRQSNGYHPPADAPIPDEPRMVRDAPEAVRMLWRITSNWPAADLHDWLAGALGDRPDEETFRRVYLAWRARGYKATNWEGICEWYKDARANPNWQPPAQGKPTTAKPAAAPVAPLKEVAPGLY